MNTPIADFIDRYIEADTVRFHMPGHKGSGSIEKYDITEIEGADVLYSADGIINESENNASSLFGTAHTFYSTEGSTLAIKAMLACVSKGKNKKILAARNVHKSFIYGCALLDLSCRWLYPKSFTHLCSCIITADDVANALSKMDELPCAVYITSPDYLGNIADIEGIAKICKSYNVPLLVDNAHGAYLKFLTPSRHPIDLGAAMCADSAHKTLPVLTGGAYLHVSKKHSEYAEKARSALSVFASTSPSYLILRSLDLCNKYLDENIRTEISNCIELTESAKTALQKKNVFIEKSEPLKIVITASKIGYSGIELSDTLRNSKIEPEFSDNDYVVLMVSPKNTERDFERLIAAFESIIPNKPKKNENIYISKAKRAISIREAVFSPYERVSVDKALGRICASPTVSCPPAIPISVSGELISEYEIKVFRYYGIDSIEVVK